jgi:hypothetical protein
LQSDKNSSQTLENFGSHFNIFRDAGISIINEDEIQTSEETIG